jgi:hypothetical protein
LSAVDLTLDGRIPIRLAMKKTAGSLTAEERKASRSLCRFQMESYQRKSRPKAIRVADSFG